MPNHLDTYGTRNLYQYSLIFFNYLKYRSIFSCKYTILYTPYQPLRSLRVSNFAMSSPCLVSPIQCLLSAITNTREIPRVYTYICTQVAFANRVHLYLYKIPHVNTILQKLITLYNSLYSNRSESRSMYIVNMIITFKQSGVSKSSIR